MKIPSNQTQFPLQQAECTQKKEERYRVISVPLSVNQNYGSVLLVLDNTIKQNHGSDDEQ